LLRQDTRAVLALVAGAVGIAFAPIFAKLAVEADGHANGEIFSPAAIAFWRTALAAPFFAVPWLRARRAGLAGTAFRWGQLVPGFAFALDLAIWHWAFEFTSVANATLEANFAVIPIAFISWRWLKEPLTPLYAVGAALAIGGMARLVGAGVAGGGDAWIGDLMGLSVAFAYAAYQISTKVLLRRDRVTTVMAWACMGSALFLALGAAVSPGHFVPRTDAAWIDVVLLALVSQVFGQGMIVYGLSRVPAGFAAVVLILQPVVAAGLGWLMLGQKLSPVQIASGLVVLGGIYLARRGSRGPRPG
jgi:drug/metabolite transporter (DMT)-like permease